MREAFMKFNYMPTAIGVLPIDSTGMRKLSDALEAANAKLKEYEEKEQNKEPLKWPSQALYSDGFGGARVGWTCPYCKQYVPHAGKYCGKCGERVLGGDE